MLHRTVRRIDPSSGQRISRRYAKKATLRSNTGAILYKKSEPSLDIIMSTSTGMHIRFLVIRYADSHFDWLSSTSLFARYRTSKNFYAYQYTVME
jgi:hypothetical protein